MRWVITGAGVLLFLLGAVWLFQGVGVIRGSVMTGQSFWAAMGLILIVVGALVGFWGYRRKPSNPQA